MSTNIDRETKPVQSASGTAFFERLASKIGASAHASTVFAEPVEKDGITVIPVSRAWWGFGGGAGLENNPNENQTGEGAGAGGGAMVSPVGYIELKDGRARYRPIYSPTTLLQVIIASGIAAALVLRGVRKLVRS